MGKKVGRPSDYSADMAALICSMISDGQSVREICASDDMPDKATVFRWLGIHEEFRDQYALACNARAEHMADEILDIADNGENDWMERRNDEGETVGWRENGEAIQRSKLRVDTRKWLLSKLQPKKYGDKLDLNHGAQDSLVALLQAVDGRTRGLPNGG